MRIENDMHVSASMEEAWALLTDIPAIAPCLPGAKLIGQDGHTYEGTMKVKVGPIVAEYSGTATVVEMNKTDRTVKLTASGRDKRGAGNASADIFASMVEADGGTTVSIATDLKVAGKVAQFGRGAMADISKKLLGQFAECIEAKLQQADVVDEAETEPETIEAPNDEAEASAPEPEVSIDDDDDVLDLMGVAGGALAKRLIPAVGGVVAAVIVYLIVRN
ncbi:MAG TPA: membrane oxidoreductase [Acidimicrobiaceae bacterium]|nr:membrane oxidoreductase [Acidimicrobiaceae bacterium]HCH79404.1 membrane oxidoreductase [Acidimicrobiaceae bacterium]|tara:strand:- start:113 stop:772 length:660 start_codon:yes stop_codon:yes gene_type:complete